MKKGKYIGLQSKLVKRSKMLSCMGAYSCLFLCLCSIAEEYNDSHHTGIHTDILESAVLAREKGLLADDWTCLDSVGILNALTDTTWKREELSALPKSIPSEMYTVEKWYNKNTGLTHFRRRWGDTLVNSKTVKEGKLQVFYAFSHEVLKGGAE